MCDECNFRSNTVRKLEDHEREMHGPVDGEPREEIGARKMIEDVLDFGNNKKRKPKPTHRLAGVQKKARNENERFEYSSLKTVIARTCEKGITKCLLSLAE